jgi:hypothetical protein
MRSIAKVVRMLIYWTAEFITFLVCFIAVDYAFKGRWTMTAGLLILWVMLHLELTRLRDWAEKF